MTHLATCYPIAVAATCGPTELEKAMTTTTCTAAIDAAAAAARAACEQHDAATLAYTNAVRDSDSLTVWAKHVAEVKRTERAHLAAVARLEQAERIGACDANH